MTDDNQPPTQATVFAFLDNLRDSGEVNMMGATPYLRRKFRFSKRIATQWLIRWINLHKE